MTHIVDAAFKRTRVVMTALFVMIAFGVISYRNIPREADPDIALPGADCRSHHLLFQKSVTGGFSAGSEQRVRDESEPPGKSLRTAGSAAQWA